MAIRLRHRSPTGETRPWTLREVIQGMPIDRPTHPMLIHFPIAFYIGTLALDVLSRLGHPSAPLAATWLNLAALAGFAAAATAGLADRSTMKPGLKVRKLATRHMQLQFVAAAVFAVELVARWPHRHDARSSILWILLGLVGVMTMTAAADIGGVMVYKIGYRPEAGSEPS